MKFRALVLAVTLALASPAVAADAPPSPFAGEIAAAKAAMMAEPNQALVHARAAARLAASDSDPRARLLATAEAQWLEGEALTRVNQPDKADPVVEAALREVTRHAPRSKLNGDLLMTAATIDWMTGRIKEALAGFQQAHGIYAKLGEARSQAKALQYIGTIYFDARDYPRMLRYYRQSEEAYSGDPALTVSALNNQGDALKEMKRFPEAIDHYRRALVIARQLQSPVLETRILTNIASAQYQSGHHAAAESFANRGLARAAGQDTGWERFLYGVKAQAALARGDLAAARAGIERTFAGTDLATTQVQLREFHETAYKLYEKLGEDKLALAHLAAFKRLDDEQRDVTASTVSALSAAQFDFTNQELSITKLKAGQLQRDIALERSRNRLREITLYGLIGTLVVAAAVLAGTLFALFSIRRSRNEVRAANDTLSVTNGALEKALKAKTEFLATTSHEIRTPLNGILGMTQVLMADRRLDAQVRDKVAVVHGAGETMRALVDDILDVAKMEKGELVIAPQDMDLGRVLDETMRLWSGQAEAKRLALSADVAHHVPRRIVADEARLRQVIFNLMSNAIKFTPAGSVLLSATVDADETLVIAVADTGIGIPEDRHAEIFEPFKQLDGGTDRRFGGTGLGLSICRNLVTAMGGTIGVASRTDEGATFTVRLPLVRTADTASAAEATRRSGPPASLADAALLMVEANPLAQSILRAVLEPATARLEIVADGDAALAAIEAGGCDLLLIEGASAAIDGGPAYDGLAVLIAAAKARGLPVALMAKPTDELPLGMLATLGADQLVVKPAAAPAVLQALARLCAPAANITAAA